LFVHGVLGQKRSIVAKYLQACIGIGLQHTIKTKTCTIGQQTFPKAILDKKTLRTLNQTVANCMPKKIIILNAHKIDERTLCASLNPSVVEAYQTNELILHIKKDLSLSFMRKKHEVDFNSAYVFTRMHTNVSLFCGILYEHFRANNIEALDPINAYYKPAEGKIAQMPRLARAGIRVPETIIAREESYACNKRYILKHMQFPLVYKTGGTRGNAVFKINTQEELEASIKEKREFQRFLLQELVANTFDTRTLVAFNTVLGSIKRTAKKGHFLNNVSSGGRVSEYALSNTDENIALRATNICQLDFGGVDFIHTEEGPVVLEVNKSPQIEGFEKVHGKGTVFKKIAALLKEKR